MPKQETVLFKRLFEGVKLPRYASEGDAGFDLPVHNIKKVYGVSSDDAEYYPGIQPDSVILYRGMRVLVGCGFAIKLPEGYELQIRSRSGKSLKEGPVVANSPGTIDSGYTGEIGVILLNVSSDIVTIKVGDLVAQAVLKEYVKCAFEIVEELPETYRGENGFGHSDIGTMANNKYMFGIDPFKIIN